MKAFFAYIPVVHAGVLSFLATCTDRNIYILDNAVAAAENVYLERDIRALPAHLVAQELAVHGYQVTVVTPADLESALSGYSDVLVPHDEIVFDFLGRHVPNISYTVTNVFLRWTKLISSNETMVPPDRTITTEAFAQEVMSKVEQIATNSPDWWRQIAAVIIQDQRIVAEAFNAHYPTAHSLEINGDPRSNYDAGQGAGIYTSIHAEACAIAKAAKSGVSTDGADMYVSTFPCPNCARSLVEAGIKRVFYKKGYSVLDAENILRDAGIEIILVC
jgi:deoxycytidylate deaminase